MAGHLNKLRIEFTCSSQRTSNDNALAEPENGAVVRDVFGYTHIPQRNAARFNTFCVEYLNAFLNVDRSCLFATAVPDPKRLGRIRRACRPAEAMVTPGKLASLTAATKHLRPGITVGHLQQLARAFNDVQAAEKLNEARAAPFRKAPARA